MSQPGSDRRSERSGREPEKKKLSDVVASSRQVWLAGLGALATAQEEGARALDELVKRGQEIEQRLKRETAQPNSADARAAGRRGVPPRGSEKLTLLFEQRVARALPRLGIPTATEVKTLTSQVRKLSTQVDKLSATVEALEKRLVASRPPEQ